MTADEKRSMEKFLQNREGVKAERSRRPTVHPMVIQERFDAYVQAALTGLCFRVEKDTPVGKLAELAVALAKAAIQEVDREEAKHDPRAAVGLDAATGAALLR